MTNYSLICGNFSFSILIFKRQMVIEFLKEEIDNLQIEKIYNMYVKRLRNYMEEAEILLEKPMKLF